MGHRILGELAHMLKEQRRCQSNFAASAAAAAAAAIEEDVADEVKVHGGRAFGSRNIQSGQSAWLSDYFGDTRVYTDQHFRRRFRVPKRLFWRLHDELLCSFWNDFSPRKDAVGKQGHRSEVRVLVALRKLGTGRSNDDLDNGARMSEETVRITCSLFCQRVVELYGSRYLNKRLTNRQLEFIESKYRERGFTGCVGAVDCCKIRWKNCPKALKGQYFNPKDDKLAVVSVEAWCDHDLYIWHWFAGTPGTNNDKTVLGFSPLFDDILTNTYSDFRLPPYSLSDTVTRQVPYFLVDGIYPPWNIFAQPIHEPSNDAEKRYTKLQEALRKDIERCFGVLQSRFGVLRQENKQWYLNNVIIESQACVVIHNMLVEMKLRGELSSGEEEEHVNVLEEFLEDLETGEEYEGAAETGNGTSTVPSNGMDSDTMMAFQHLYKSHNGFATLRNALIQSVTEGIVYE